MGERDLCLRKHENTSICCAERSLARVNCHVCLRPRHRCWRSDLLRVILIHAKCWAGTVALFPFIVNRKNDRSLFSHSAQKNTKSRIWIFPLNANIPSANAFWEREKIVVMFSFCREWRWLSLHAKPQVLKNGNKKRESTAHCMLALKRPRLRGRETSTICNGFYERTEKLLQFYPSVLCSERRGFPHEFNEWMIASKRAISIYFYEKSFPHLTFWSNSVCWCMQSPIRRA